MANGLKITTEIKRIVFADQTANVESIGAALRLLGFENPSSSSISTVRADFLNSLAFLREVDAFASVAPAAPAKKKKAVAASRASRWADACNEARSGMEALQSLQEEYSEWKESLPENLASSPVGEKLEAVCDLDIESALGVIDEAESVDLPMGFGRD